MEGFSAEALDKIPGLGDLNLSAVSVLTLGYRDATNDQLASDLKVRKSKEDLFIIQ